VEKRRNYRQFCGLARALDRVGERWTLLVVRNLLLGPKRYSDLIEELPGITTNLLAARLREMQRLGLVVKRKAPAPVRATLYELAPSGRALEPALMELARWGSRFMDRPGTDDTFNVGWALLSLKRRYRGGLRLVAELIVDERSFELVLDTKVLSVSEGATRPDVVVRGSLDAVRAWLFRGADPVALRHEGALVVDGSEQAFHALCGAFAAREVSAEEMATQGSAGGARMDVL
jgi:DNA-binding HxlR family transcriptional regulator